MLPKIHKENIPGRLIVDSSGSITEKISAYVDGKIRPLVPSITSFVKDTTHFINLRLGRKLKEEDMLVTIDVNSLHTNIPHKDGIVSIH